MNLRTPARLTTSGLLALSVVAGVTATTTSPASAVVSTVGTKACTEWARLNTTVSATVKLRSGPGTKYVAMRQLAKNTKVYWSCTRGLSGSGKSWGHVLVKSGANKGKSGWVARRYINTPMQLS